MYDYEVKEMISCVANDDVMGLALTVYEYYEENPFVMEYLEENLDSSALQQVASFVEAFQENCPDEVLDSDDYRDAYVSFVELFGEYSLESFQDSYRGHYSTLKEFAQEQFENYETWDVSERLQNYIDYEAYGRDLMHDFTSCESGFYFCNHY